MQVFETTATKPNDYILIVDENGKSETVEELKSPPSKENMEKITITLNSIADKGYKLVSTVGTAIEIINHNNNWYTTYVFVKK